jgi:hypothetical protein
MGASGLSLRMLPGAAGLEALRVAVVAPPWIPVPPSGYGGIEAVVELLCEAWNAPERLLLPVSPAV